MGPVPETDKQRSREAVGHCRTQNYRHTLLDRLCHQLTMEGKQAGSTSGPPLVQEGTSGNGRADPQGHFQTTNLERKANFVSITSFTSGTTMTTKMLGIVV